ncbi:MAG: hypothetical protein JJU28_08945 [Cyclobacteriaceae bacterium]|nr:hypothetical protein [Cyclobacteriaceae bacterium]
MKIKTRTRLFLILAALLSLGLIVPHVFGSDQPEISYKNSISEAKLPNHNLNSFRY